MGTDPYSDMIPLYILQLINQHCSAIILLAFSMLIGIDTGNQSDEKTFFSAISTVLVIRAVPQLVRPS